MKELLGLLQSYLGLEVIDPSDNIEEIVVGGNCGLKNNLCSKTHCVPPSHVHDYAKCLSSGSLGI